MRSWRDSAAIVGTGETEFARDIGRPERTIAAEAVKAALDDAGLAPSSVDGVVSMTMDRTDEVEIARNLGFGDLTFFSQISGGGGGGAALIGQAALAVASGQAEVVVVFRARNRGSGPRPWTGGLLHEYQTWTRPYGLTRPVDEVALWARRYFDTYGVTREQLASVALSFREHALANPRAIMRKPMTLEDYLTVRWISEPLCLYDCSLESDGAVAFVVTDRARARDLRSSPVVVHAFAQGLNAQYQQMVNFHAEDPLGGPGDVGAAKLWSSSDVGPDDVDVTQIYDVFSPIVLKTLEAYRFCKPGEAAEFAADGQLRVDNGSLPTNTAGGSLSEAYVHGMNLLTEGVKQLRGTAVNQVPGAEVCFVSSAVCAPHSSVLLTREETS